MRQFQADPQSLQKYPRGNEPGSQEEDDRDNQILPVHQTCILQKSTDLSVQARFFIIMIIFTKIIAKYAKYSSSIIPRRFF